MTSSSNGNIFGVTGHLWGEHTGHRWILLTKAITRSFGIFFAMRLNKRVNKQSRRQWFETPSCSLWRHCNNMDTMRGSWDVLYVWLHGCLRILYYLRPLKRVLNVQNYEVICEVYPVLQMCLLLIFLEPMLGCSWLQRRYCTNVSLIINTVVISNQMSFFKMPYTFIAPLR